MTDKPNIKETKQETPWFLYMIRCKGGLLYTGITTDVTRRFKQHESGKGAKFLRGKGPLSLVFKHPAGNRSEASKLEAVVKKWAKADKEQVIEKGWSAQPLC